RGVRGIKLEGDDRVAGVAAVDEADHQWLLTVTENGYGKRTDIGDYRVQSRNGKGLIDIKTNERNGRSVAVEAVSSGDHLVVMSGEGQILRTRVDDVSAVGRNTMGVIVMDLDARDGVSTVDVVPASVLEAVGAGEDGEAEADGTEVEPLAEDEE
ncbi:DNA gyrase C-terminal beta-propeller domain-containing protein, partial [Halobium palmae]